MAIELTIQERIDASGSTVQCCVCWKIKEEDGTWSEGPGKAIPASHTYCPECYKPIRDDINRLRALKGKEPVK